MCLLKCNHFQGVADTNLTLNKSAYVADTILIVKIVELPFLMVVRENKTNTKIKGSRMHFLDAVVRILAISALIFLIGCAFGTREVKLRNTSVGDADTISVSKVNTICFDSLIDKRIDSTIGHVQNGSGMSTAEVVAVNDVSNWINKEIKNKLATAGYEVRSNCSMDTSSLVISGEILKVYATAYMTYLGEVTIKASILRNQNKLLEKEYSGYKKTVINWVATDKSYRDILESSLQIALTKFMKDIDSLDQHDSRKDLSI